MYRFDLEDGRVFVFIYVYKNIYFTYTFYNFGIRIQKVISLIINFPDQVVFVFTFAMEVIKTERDGTAVPPGNWSRH